MHSSLSYVKDYKGQNLLAVYDKDDPGRFARAIMKILFTSAEMSQSILYANPAYAKPGLDSDRMVIFKGKCNRKLTV